MTEAKVPEPLMSPIREAWAERLRAHNKHKTSPGGSMEQMSPTSLSWLAVLGEEVGEVTEEMMILGLNAAMGRVARFSTYDQDHANIRKELIQVIGVAWAWVNAIDNEIATKAYIAGFISRRVTLATTAETNRRIIDEHHDRMHGLCVHGELPGECDNGGYIRNFEKWKLNPVVTDDPASSTFGENG